MFKKACLLSGAVFFLAALCFPGISKGGPPLPLIPMTARFGDATGDLITSDHRGEYKDGEGRVECNINPNTGDFRLNLNNTPNPARQVYALLGLAGQAQTTCSPVSPPPTPIPPDPVGCGFVNVHNLLNLITGGLEETGAFLFSASAGTLRFNPNDDPCSTKVFVQYLGRNSANKRVWQIYTSVPDHGIAVLQQRSGKQTVPVGYYPLPFTLTVWEL